MFIDTHTHLFYPNFKDDVDEVITRAIENGISYMVVPGTDIPTSEEAIQLAEKYDFIYAAAGVHPHDTAELAGSWLSKVRELAAHPKVVAIGEIGLDYYYDFSPKEKQIEAFKMQIDLAIELNLPIIVHSRDSHNDVMEIIRSYKATSLRAQFHCFAGSAEEAKELISLGHVVSFTGNVTFKKMDSIREIVKQVDINSLMIETDSPFMTPVPHRGKRNEPSYVKLVAEKIAELHQLSIEEVASLTSKTAIDFFNLPNKNRPILTYRIGNSLYINVTNRCNADCVFCDRKGDAEVHGYRLKMKKSDEPKAEEYIAEIGDPKQFDEVVFCGYGEPTIRWEIVKTVSEYIKSNGGKTRLNTDGHGSYINKYDITPELKGRIDTVSISLNSVNKKQYAKLMNVDEKLHEEMILFASKAKKYCDVVMSIVGLSTVDTEHARKFVEDEIGVKFRLREYF